MAAAAVYRNRDVNRKARTNNVTFASTKQTLLNSDSPASYRRCGDHENSSTSSSSTSSSRVETRDSVSASSDLKNHGNRYESIVLDCPDLSEETGVAAVLGNPNGEALSRDIQSVTIVMLGSRSCGKSSLLRQFVLNEYNEEYKPTRSRGVYYTSVVVNERIYEVKLVDCSSVRRFPRDSMQEWNECRGYCLRTATAYILVYDVTDDNSFRFIRLMRDQIVRCREGHNVIIFVAANKQDLIVQRQVSPSSSPRTLNANRHSHPTTYWRTTYNGNYDSNYSTTCDNYNGSCSATSTVDNILRTAKNRDAQTNIVKKHWKCGYVECSAKYNWRVTHLFRDVMRAVDHSRHGHRAAATAHRVQQALLRAVDHAHHGHRTTSSGSVQHAMRMERCVIL